MIQETMTNAVMEAGEIIRNYFGSDYEVEEKGDKGLVTQADKEAENKILEILNKKFDYGVVAEESGVTESDSEYYWVIDPIDGTTNFSRGIPIFCTSIALFKGDEIEAALTYQPMSGELFYAEKGKGMTLNGKTIARTDKNMRSKVPVIGCNKGYSQEAAQKYLGALSKISEKYSTNRVFGTSALEQAYFSAGRFDCFITYGDELYDVAAGILLAKESGYIVTNWKGEKWTKDSLDLLMAPAWFHEELVGHLAKLID